MLTKWVRFGDFFFSFAQLYFYICRTWIIIIFFKVKENKSNEHLVFASTEQTHVRNGLPQKGYIPQGSALVFGRKERLYNNRKHWEAEEPRLPSRAVLETMAACGSGILGRK